ncbi:MAG: nucleoside deaminase [Oligoflexia bacterium]
MSESENSNSPDPMLVALELAKRAAAQDEVPVGAVILHEGKVIGEGWNQRESKQDPLSHAEVEAIRAAASRLNSWRLEGCTLVVTLEPCPMCLAAAQQARIRTLIYGADDPKGGALSLGYRFHEDVRVNHRFEVRRESKPECGSILTEFFKKKRSSS